MAELSVRDGKLVQYLNEAYGKEKELEIALAAHIEMTSRAPYKKRLREHLTQTKRHARELEKRVKQLALAGRVAAAAQGPLHAIRGTGEQEKMLKNAKSEYADEHEEIATYSAIETLAEALADAETAKLARAIRREEESMARFLARQIPALAKSVVQAEVPPAQRKSIRATRRRSAKPARAKAKAAPAKR